MQEIPSMPHTGGNLICVIDVETTNSDIEKAEITELCIIPVDITLKPSTIVSPLILKIKPDYPEDIDVLSLNITRKTMSEIMSSGVSQDEACDLINKWYENLKLPYTKRIMPLGFNYLNYDAKVLSKLLGKANYELIFHHQARDVLVAALFVLDKVYMFNEVGPFLPNDLRMGSLASQLGITPKESHNAVDDCMTCLEVYRRLMGLSTTLGDLVLIPIKPNRKCSNVVCNWTMHVADPEMYKMCPKCKRFKTKVII